MNPTIRTRLASAAVVAALATTWWFGIRATDQRITTLQHEERTMQRELKSSRANAPLTTRAAPRAGDVEHALRLVNDALPPVRQWSALLDDLVVLAQLHGLNLEGCSSEPLRREPAFYELPVDLRLLGTFEAFYGFLLSLEGSPQVMRVTGLDMRKVAAADEPMQVKLELSLFFRPDD